VSEQPEDFGTPGLPKVNDPWPDWLAPGRLRMGKPKYKKIAPGLYEIEYPFELLPAGQEGAT
jgi:hypothetical protein